MVGADVFAADVGLAEIGDEGLDKGDIGAPGRIAPAAGGRAGVGGARPFVTGIVVGLFLDCIGVATDGAATAIRTVNSALHAGHFTFFPLSCGEPLNFLEQCEHWTMLVLAATFGCGLAGEAVRAGDCVARAEDAAAPPALSGGIVIGVLHAGQGSRLPASSSGALNFLEHFLQATVCGIACPLRLHFIWLVRSRNICSSACKM